MHFLSLVDEDSGHQQTDKRNLRCWHLTGQPSSQKFTIDFRRSGIRETLCGLRAECLTKVV